MVEADIDAAKVFIWKSLPEDVVSITFFEDDGDGTCDGHTIVALQAAACELQEEGLLKASLTVDAVKVRLTTLGLRNLLRAKAADRGRNAS